MFDAWIGPEFGTLVFLCCLLLEVGLFGVVMKRWALKP